MEKNFIEHSQKIEYAKYNNINELELEIAKRAIDSAALIEINNPETEKLIEKFHMLPMEKPEIRKAYFLKDFNRTVEDMMIMSFGSCNYDCPYCKRDGQFKDENNNIVRSSDYSWDLIKTRLDDSAGKGMKVRLSGGDPCMYPKESLQIAEYMSREHNQKISIAHNGGSPKFVEKILPYLDYAAIDIKGDTNEELCFRAGIAEHDALTKVFESINLCADNNILVDIRTCVFGDTTLNQLQDIKNLISQNVKKTKNVFWTLRKYNEISSCDFEAGNSKDIKEMAEVLSQNCNFSVGFRDKWTGTNFQIW